MTTFAGSPQSPEPPDHLLSLKEAEERLEPYKALLAECIQHGWDAWRRDYASKHAILDARTRAGIVFCEIVVKVQQVFDGLPGVTFRRKRNSFLLFIGNDIIIRFKKIRRNGLCSSINTKQQVLFKLQQMVLVFPDMKEATLLNAGYALDDLQTDISSKLVSCQFANRVVWTIELVGGSAAEIVALPAPPPPTTPKGPRYEPATETQDKGKRKTKRKEG